jgi:hypothetical protein
MASSVGVEARIGDVFAKTRVRGGSLALFNGNSGTTGMKAETALILARVRRCFFPCGQNCAESLIGRLPLRTERGRQRKTTDFALMDCAERSPLI